MEENRALETLAQCRLFAGFSPEELAEWARRFDCRFAFYGKGQPVAAEETAVEKLAIVCSGEFFAGKRADGAALTNIYRAGQILGLPEYCSSLGTWARSCQCSAAGELLWFDPRPLMEAEEPRQSLRFHANLETVIANAAVKLFYRTEVIAVSPLRERILLFLRMMQGRYGQENQVRLHMNRSQLAEYLAVDRSTLSRELAKLEKSGELRLGDSYTYYLLK